MSNDSWVILHYQVVQPEGPALITVPRMIPKDYHEHETTDDTNSNARVNGEDDGDSQSSSENCTSASDESITTSSSSSSLRGLSRTTARSPADGFSTEAPPPRPPSHCPPTTPSHTIQNGRKLVRKRSCITISEMPQYRSQQQQIQGRQLLTPGSSAANSSPDSSQREPPLSSQKSSTSSPHHKHEPQEVDDEPMRMSQENDAELQQLRNRQVLFARLEASAPRGKLSLINLARHEIGVAEALLLKEAIVINPHLSVLKLAYNCLGDQGAQVIASALNHNGLHHENLSVLDIGFNEIGDVGCEALAVQVLAGNHTIRSLYLTGNQIRVQGALAIAGAVVHGTGLTRLFLAANRIRSKGLKAIASAIAQHDAAQLASFVTSTNNMNGGMYNDGEGSRMISGMEELDMGCTSIDSSGFIAIPAMLLSNATLQSLCLSNNNIDDNDMMLLSQSLAQNKNVPLRSLKLSFNQITCQGVECLMNAIWGSPTLRELALDNNKIQDRGAQLCAVVLTSIALERLDLAFNRVTTLGLKALMKNISENNSLQSLGLCGIPIDLNGSKAVSYALAYNSSLRAVYLDNCSTGYSSQRHIVAGIVSNRRSSLRVLTGFSIGPVARTLGMPNLPEPWSNDQVLGFFRLMWQQWLLKSGRGVAPSEDDDAVRGPAPPAAVAAAAKITLSALALGTNSRMDKLFHTEAHEKPVTEGPPVESAGSALLERTDSGTMRVPSFPDALVVSMDDTALPEQKGGNDRSERTFGSSTGAAVSTVRGPLENPERRNRNLQWLRQHFRSLGEVGRLPFNNADLWQLHQYYFSPPFSATVDDNEGNSSSPFVSSSSSPSPSPSGESHRATGEDEDEMVVKAPTAPLASNGDANPLAISAIAPPPTPAFGAATAQSGMGRAVSFQALGDAFAASGLLLTNKNGRTPPPSHKRRSSHPKGSAQDDDGPATKRAKGLSKPRIAYYPRVMVKIQSLGTKPMEHSLSLLRQLKYTENIIFAGRDPYANEPKSPRSPSSFSSSPSTAASRKEDDDANLSHSDVEMILLDLL